MTIELRYADFASDGERLFLAGRTIPTRDLLSVAIQRRTSVAFILFTLIGAALLVLCFKVQSVIAVLAAFGMASLAFFGARHEWLHPYVLVLQIYQLGTFEVVGIDAKEAAALMEHFDTF